MLPLFALILAAGSSPNTAPCPGTTTIQVNACLSSRLSEADSILNQYYQVALKRLRKDNSNGIAQKLIQAERSWIAYRDGECGAVTQSWSGGTISTSVGLNCQIRLAQLRTYVIWRNWLTYPDSTPPLLPRPKIEEALADRR